MARPFARTNAVLYANRAGRYPAMRSKINGRLAHVVVTERQSVRLPDAIEENTDAQDA